MMRLALEITQPWWLLAAGAAVLPVLLARWAARRGRHIPAGAVALQCLAVALAAGALAQPAVMLPEDARGVWLVLRDASASTRGQRADLPADFAGPVGTIQTVPFAEAILSPGQASAGQWTHLRPPLQLALARQEELAGVVVVSDGRWHDAWADSARALAPSGLPVLIVPLDQPPPDARVADFRARRQPDGTAELSVSLAANAHQQRRLTVTRQGDLTPLLVKDLELLAGDSFTLHLADPQARQAPQEPLAYRAVLSPPDAFPENDQASALLPPLSGVLAVVSADGAWRPADLPGRLPCPMKDVPPADAPTEAEGWSAYSAVLLIDPDGDLLTSDQRSALAQYARTGGGLVVLGTGPHASAADRDDPLNRVAALRPDPFDRRPLKLVLVLDASGSMAERGSADGRRKFDLAAEAALSLRSHLTQRDSLAVVTFSDSSQVVYDSRAGPPDFAALLAALGKVQPAGPTVVDPALELATAGPPPPGKDALVILVSDLATRPFDERAMAERFRRNGASLSIVAVRSGADAQVSLLNLAGRLSAAIVRQDDLAGLAGIFARFLRAARGPAVRRGQFHLEGGEGLADWPALDAYVLSAAAEQAEVLGTVGADPVVARRPAGLGRAASLAIPTGPADNRALRGSGAFAGELAGLVVWSLRPPDAGDFSATVQPDREGWRLTVEDHRPDGKTRSLVLSARLSRDRDEQDIEVLPLLQVGPGRYEAMLPRPAEPAPLQIIGPGQAVLWSGSYGGAGWPEFDAIGPNWPNLRRLAKLSGGRIVAAADLTAVGRQLRQRRFRPLWPVLLGAALAIMLAEWGLTRVRRR